MNKPSTTIQAKEIKVDDVLAIRKVGERVVSVTHRERHVYVATDYTKETACGDYDLDRFQKVRRF